MRISLLLFLLLAAPQVVLAAPVLRGAHGIYTVSEFVAVSPQRAWAILTDFNSQANWAPDISNSKVLKSSDSRLELQQTYKAGYTLGLPIKAKLMIKMYPPMFFSYKLIQGERLNDLEGQWSITPIAGGIRLSHKMRVDPKVPGFLRPIYYEQQEKNLLHWMRILKHKMETPETYQTNWPGCTDQKSWIPCYVEKKLKKKLLSGIS